jgi:ATP-dependent helicase/nuclease subunit B
MISAPKIYTIPLGIPYAEALAKGLLEAYKDKLLDLSDIHLYLPSRRSGHLLRDAFLAASNGQATLLPRFIAIGDMDEEDLFDIDPLIFTTGQTPPSMIAPLERQMIMMEWIMARRDLSLSPAQAFRLAAELAHLIDRSHTEQIDLNQLQTLVTGDMAIHWEKTLVFLQIITTQWPAYLVENNLCDPAFFRSALLKSKIAAIQKQQPDTPYIVAGTYGQTSLAQELMCVISRLPNGCVILPAFDPNYPDHYWQNSDITHPYHGCKLLLDRLDYHPKNVTIWPLLSTEYQETKQAPLIHAALQPVASYSLDDCPKTIHFDTLGLIEADHLHHEAESISLMLRDLLEKPTQTALVITPDRLLAKNIIATMQRWDIQLHDSAGTILLQTTTCQFLRLICQFTDTVRPASDLLSLLQHSFFALIHESVESIDREILRKSLTLEDLFLYDENEENSDFLLQPILQTLSFTQQRKPQTLEWWISQHIACAETLANGADALWRLEEAEELTRQLIALKNVDQAEKILLSGQEYTQFFIDFFQGVTFQSDQKTHPRIKIIAPHEALFYNADHRILCGLNEKIWPAPLHNSPWLSRPMMAELGFCDAQEKIGQAAFDFQSVILQPFVTLSWSKERDNAMSLMSRWVQQLIAVWEKTNTDYQNYILPYARFAQHFDHPKILTPRKRPSIQVQPHHHCNELSVSDIQLWFNDPYGLYAKKILYLKPLDPLDRPMGYSEWGIVVHDVISKIIITKQKPDIQDIISSFRLEPLHHLRWQQQLARIVTRTENYLQNKSGQLFSEMTGKITLDTEYVSFTVKGRADLIHLINNTIQIIDFKTGTVATNVQIKENKSPQLPLLGLIAQQNGFKIYMKPSDITLEHVQVKGKEHTDFEVLPLKECIHTIQETKDFLMKKIEATFYHNIPYEAKEMLNTKHDAYTHLKRITEWSVEVEEYDG